MGFLVVVAIGGIVVLIGFKGLCCKDSQASEDEDRGDVEAYQMQILAWV